MLSLVISTNITDWPVLWITTNTLNDKYLFYQIEIIKNYRAHNKTVGRKRTCRAKMDQQILSNLAQSSYLSWSQKCECNPWDVLSGITHPISKLFHNSSAESHFIHRLNSLEDKPKFSRFAPRKIQTRFKKVPSNKKCKWKRLLPTFTQSLGETYCKSGFNQSQR